MGVVVGHTAYAHPQATNYVQNYVRLQLHLRGSVCTGVEALNLAKWPIGGHQEQAVMSSIGHMWRLTQLDLTDSLVTFLHSSVLL